MIIFVRDNLDEFECTLKEMWRVGVLRGEESMEAEDEVGDEDLSYARQLGPAGCDWI